jgi:hypothetical protein
MKYLIALLGALTMAGANAKMSRDLQNAARNPVVSVIVQSNRPQVQNQLDAAKRHGGLPAVNLGLGVINARTSISGSATCPTAVYNPAHGDSSAVWGDFAATVPSRCVVLWAPLYS